MHFELVSSHGLAASAKVGILRARRPQEIFRHRACSPTKDAQIPYRPPLARQSCGNVLELEHGVKPHACGRRKDETAATASVPTTWRHAAPQIDRVQDNTVPTLSAASDFRAAKPPSNTKQRGWADGSTCAEDARLGLAASGRDPQKPVDKPAVSIQTVYSMKAPMTFLARRAGRDRPIPKRRSLLLVQRASRNIRLQTDLA